MPTIEVTEDQHDRLEALRDELAEEFVDGYGTVRQVDAVEYLLDLHAEADGVAGPDAGDTTTPEEDGGEDDGEEETAADDGGGTTDDGGDRLSAMMNLLDDHDGKWRETDADGGNYEVDLPDGGAEVVRTKDDIKAVLFKHY